MLLAPVAVTRLALFVELVTSVLEAEAYIKAWIKLADL